MAGVETTEHIELYQLFHDHLYLFYPRQQMEQPVCHIAGQAQWSAPRNKLFYETTALIYPRLRRDGSRSFQ